MTDLFLFDKEKKVIGILAQSDLLSYVQEQNLNGTITAEVQGLHSEIVEQAFYFGSRDIERKGIFWRYKITSLEINSSDKTFSVNGIYELFDDLKNRNVIKDKRPANLSVRSALEIVLDGTTWRVGNINSNNTASSNWYYKSALDAFWDFLQKWRVEFKPRMIFRNNSVEKYIDIYNQLSDNYGKWYEYGDKLLNITAEENNANIATAFYIRGKGEEHTDESGEVKSYGRRITISDVVWSKSKGDPLNKPYGQEYIELEESTKQFGYEDGSPRFDVLIFEEIEDKQELINAGYQEALNRARPQRQFKATITENEFAELGEISTIIDTRLNIRYQTRTFRIKRDFLNPRFKEIELGDKLLKSRAETITSITSKKVIEQTESLRAELISQYEQITTTELKEIRDDLIKGYWSSTAYTYNLQPSNEYGLPSGIYSFNAPIGNDPTRAIYFGAGLLMVANSKTPDGSWDWTTILTGDGLGANLIGAEQLKANSIQAEHIRAGAISTEKIAVGAESSERTLKDLLNDLNANDGDLSKRLEKSSNNLYLAESRLEELEDDYKRTLLANNATNTEINDKLEILEVARIELENAQAETASNLKEVEELAKTVTRTFTTDSLGRPVISKGDSNVKLVLDNDKLSFVSQGAELAYFGKDKAYISALQILQSLNLGKYTLELKADGAFSIKWID